MLTVQVFTILFIYRSKQIRMLGHFIEKVPLHLKQVGHFTGKRYFIGNGIQAYNNYLYQFCVFWGKISFMCWMIK